MLDGKNNRELARTATGSDLFFLLTCPHTTTFTLPSIFSPLEMISIKIWETPLSWNTKCSLPVAVRFSKTRVLKLPTNLSLRWELNFIIMQILRKEIVLYCYPTLAALSRGCKPRMTETAVTVEIISKDNKFGVSHGKRFKLVLNLFLTKTRCFFC